MTIVTIKSGTDAELRRIELSDGSFFSFKTCYLPPVFLDESLFTPGVAEGREINASEEAAFRFASSCLRAEKAALQLIARAEQNSFGLSRKLKKRGHEAACARAVIAHLAELELVDDCRYARLWLESRISRGASSPRRLHAALCARGIDRDDAAAALRAILDAEADAEWRLLLLFVRKQRRLRRIAGGRGYSGGGRRSDGWGRGGENDDGGGGDGRGGGDEGRRGDERDGGGGRGDGGGGESEGGLRLLKYMLKSEGFSTAAIERYIEQDEEDE